MKFLTFACSASPAEEKGVRRASFEERSQLPVAAACLVANNVRDALAALLSAEVDVRLFEPIVPTEQAWSAIVCDAYAFRLAGTRCDAAIVLRAADAAACAAAAFGEFDRCEHSLSALEQRALARTIQALSGAFSAVCGTVGAPADLPAAAIATFATYFELQVDRPFHARIGVALARDPPPERLPSLSLDDLLDVPLAVCARTEGLPVEAGRLAALAIGEIVPITERMGSLPAVLSVAGRPLAFGECGVRGTRLALALRLSSDPTRSGEPES